MTPQTTASTEAPPDRMLTDREVSDRTGIPRNTLAQWRYLSDGPPFHRLGRHVRYSERDLAAWIAAGRVDTRAAS